MIEDQVEATPDDGLDVDPEAARAGLAALRARRRSRRTADIHWFDAFYQAYITALFAAIAIAVASGAFAGDPITGSGVDQVLADGPALLGLASAVAIGVGLRSGSRGGPLALEAPDVQHVLLSAVPRRRAVMGPALRQVRFFAFAALAVGLVAGQLAARRLDGGYVAWMAAGAAWSLLTVLAAVAAGWLASGHRLHRALATGLALLLIAWAAADLAELVPSSPTAWLGRLALWPLEVEPLAALPVVVIAVALGLGAWALGELSLEAAQRRSALVGELRFAATMRDLRTVMVLRRQLTQERSRTKPWLPTRHRGGFTTVILRDWRSLDRTPAARLARMAALAVVAALAARAVWDGSTPMVIVAGLAAFVVGLDAVEPLAQEVDHPVITQLAAGDTGDVLVRHLVVPALTMLLFGLIGFFTVLATRPSAEGIAVAAITAVTASLTGLAGAVVSTLKGMGGGDASAQAQDASLMPPEAAGARVIFQAVWPPAVAIAGFLPLLIAHSASEAGYDAAGAALTWTLPVITLLGLVAGWVRFREAIHVWWSQAMEQSMSGGSSAGGR